MRHNIKNLRPKLRYTINRASSRRVFTRRALPKSGTEQARDKNNNERSTRASAAVPSHDGDTSRDVARRVYPRISPV